MSSRRTQAVIRFRQKSNLMRFRKGLGGASTSFFHFKFNRTILFCTILKSLHFVLVGCTVVKQLAFPPHSLKVLGFIPGWVGLCMVLRLFTNPNPKDKQVRIIGDFCARIYPCQRSAGRGCYPSGWILMWLSTGCALVKSQPLTG